MAQQIYEFPLPAVVTGDIGDPVDGRTARTLNEERWYVGGSTIHAIRKVLTHTTHFRPARRGPVDMLVGDFAAANADAEALQAWRLQSDAAILAQGVDASGIMFAHRGQRLSGRTRAYEISAQGIDQQIRGHRERQLDLKTGSTLTLFTREPYPDTFDPPATPVTESNYHLRALFDLVSDVL